MSIIECHSISKQYDQVVLNNISYSFDEGKIYAILGKSGAGKSTLLNILGLLEKKDEGELILCNHVNPKLNSRSAVQLLRYHIAYLFQNYALIDDKSVSYNLNIALAYDKRKNKKELIMQALNEVGLAGYENKKIHTLSGGEQQRVAFARILLKPCDIVLADEPTGNLDEENREMIYKLLQNLAKRGKTLIIVSHDKTIQHIADECLMLEGGRLV